MLLSAAKVLAWFLAIQQVPEMVAQMFMSLSNNNMSSCCCAIYF
jgi:TRAP-type C4-dicarboxylate transport system permease large subunit